MLQALRLERRLAADRVSVSGFPAPRHVRDLECGFLPENATPFTFLPPILVGLERVKKITAEQWISLRQAAAMGREWDDVLAEYELFKTMYGAGVDA